MKEATTECATLPGSEERLAAWFAGRVPPGTLPGLFYLPRGGGVGNQITFRELGSNFPGIATRSWPRGQEYFTHISSLLAHATVCTFTHAPCSSVHDQGELPAFHLLRRLLALDAAPGAPLREEARFWCEALGASLCPQCICLSLMPLS